jgi:hypothetical protein
LYLFRECRPYGLLGGTKNRSFGGNPHPDKVYYEVEILMHDRNVGHDAFFVAFLHISFGLVYLDIVASAFPLGHPLD